MKQKSTLNNRGRPSKLTDDIIKKLEEAFKIGSTISQACIYAGISMQDYYNRLSKNKEFFDKMESAKNFPYIFSKSKIFEAMRSKDLNLASKNALEFLKRKDPERKDKTETTTNIESLSEEDKALIDKFFEWKKKI